MNQRSRLLGSLAREAVDRPPFIIPGGMMNMAVTGLMDQTGCSWPKAHTDPGAMAGLTLGARDHAGVENVGVPFCMTVEAEGMGATVELGDRHHEPRVTSYAIETLDELDRLHPMDLRAGRAKAMIEAVSILRNDAGDTPVIANLTGPVSLLTSLIEPVVFYRAMVRDPAAVHQGLALVVRELIRFGDALIDAGADLICVADPSGTGEIVGKNSFAAYTVPYLNELTAHFRSRRGTPSIAHICGDLRGVGGLLGRLDADAISVDAMVGMDDLKGQVGSKATMGNVSAYTFEWGRPESLARMSRRLLERGVDILAPACGVSPRTPVANIKSVADLAKAFTPGKAREAGSVPALGA